MTTPKSIVALDLETTGLDAERDSIIEIAMVQYVKGRETERFSTLVNPGMRIPYVITQLTGITDDMVAGAPRLSEVLPRAAEVAGESAILGHNVPFDVAFFRPHRMLQYNDTIDTLELASALLPRAPRYALGALCAHRGIPQSATHRALDDALASYALFRNLMEEAAGLPLDILAEIVRHGQQVSWGGGDALEDVLRERLKFEGALVQTVLRRIPAFEPDPETRKRPALDPRDEPLAIDPKAVAAKLDDGGPFAKLFPAYERRAPQMQMAEAVANAIAHSGHLLVEAGTGTGKSLAYLLPAAEWALTNGQRVVISTNTINLQDQLIQKDIPDLTRVLGAELRAAVLKGRSNYICPRRLETLRRRGPQSAEEMRVLAKVLLWLLESRSGDRSEVNLNGPAERSVWSRLSAEDELCAPETCRLFGGDSCPFMRARIAAESAHLLVVNHALLVADVANDSKVLPEYKYLVVDEGHHLEAAATDGLSFLFSQLALERSLQELGARQGGLLGLVQSVTKRGGLPTEQGAALRTRLDECLQRSDEASRDGRSFFRTALDFTTTQMERASSDYTLQMRILPATRGQPGWEDVEEGWENLRQGLADLARRVNALGERVAEGETEQDEENLSLQLQAWARRMLETVESVQQIIAKPNPQSINWVEVQRDRGDVSLRSAPLHIGPLVEEHLWHRKESVVLTSATLTTAGKFDYLRGRLNADEADTLTVGSPFDFRNSTLLYLASDIPEPTDTHGYPAALNKTLVALCKATRGRALVLFTSHAQLRQTAKHITAPLAREGVVVYEQGEGASRHSLLETFRSAEQAVLLGTRSFWEGVDVPGEALSVVVITRLPFDVPSDPVVAARSEVFDQPFSEYSLPEAILRFRQGFGRLIRTKSDRGVAVILDRRVLTKTYGRFFLESLPDCTKQQGLLEALPARAAEWLEKRG